MPNDRKEKLHTYYLAHKEEYAERRRIWAKNNKEKLNALNQKYRDKDRAHYRGYNRKADEKRKPAFSKTLGIFSTIFGIIFLNLLGICLINLSCIFINLY